jgi:hypothetical protein
VAGVDHDGADIVEHGANFTESESRGVSSCRISFC